uniref:Uncharacterized protein n=1 Tax=Arundo donax TaxID=35708 RepID=A0A0A9GY54_ARUDO
MTSEHGISMKHQQKRRATEPELLGYLRKCRKLIPQHMLGNKNYVSLGVDTKNENMCTSFMVLLRSKL